ncbi:MAG: replicative DNA helicase [Actinomycetota bacterium]
MQSGTGPSAPGRVPPNNLQAEASVLGAMLLSREAIAEVVEILEPDHFYKPAHAHLYDAILSLYSAGEPVDAVTVAEELTRAGLLDEVGGQAVLLDFQATTPAISNASHYAKIVEEHALLRRMIYVSNEIAETAYEIPDDVAKAVDDAEAKMFDVAQKRVTNTTAPIRELLPANLDRIEMLYDRGESIIGLSTGYLDLDEQLAGLQPNALYVVGARPAMGKALALDTPLVTPTGWSTMGQIHVGDEVIDEQGRPCAVTYKSPVYVDHECFEVEFDDGSVIVADAEHQWFTWDQKAWKSRRDHTYRAARGPSAHPEFAGDQSHTRARPAVRTTAEIAATLRVETYADRRPNHRVQLAAPLDLADVELPLDPYVLGCWLGAGHTGRPQITTMDPGIVDAFALDGWTLDATAAAGPALTYTIRSDRDTEADRGHADGDGERRLLQFTRCLHSVGLWAPGRSATPVGKHIPPAYLRASAKQRLALLQGLMDTDGTVVKGETTVEIALSNERLLRDVRELALSLGYKAGPVRHRTSNHQTDVWRVVFSAPDPVFRLERKLAMQRFADNANAKSRWRVITDVRPIDPVPVQCITVDSPNSLYLAGPEMIPTHNTAFALGMAANSAMKDNRPVLIFTLEMGQLELSQRLLCSEARVDAGKVKTGRLDESEWNRISHAVGRLAETPIYIDDNPHTSVMDIRAKARRLKSREGDLGMVVVDYIQLMTGRSNAESRQVEVSEISRNLKILARELEAPVVALAQLNRGLEQRTDKRPMLSDLRESGSLEQDADVVMFLYRDEVYDDQSPDKGVAEVIVAKHRNGPTGKARLAFLGQYTRFENMARSTPGGPDNGDF